MRINNEEYDEESNDDAAKKGRDKSLIPFMMSSKVNDEEDALVTLVLIKIMIRQSDSHKIRKMSNKMSELSGCSKVGNEISLSISYKV